MTLLLHAVCNASTACGMARVTAMSSCNPQEQIVVGLQEVGFACTPCGDAFSGVSAGCASPITYNSLCNINSMCNRTVHRARAACANNNFSWVDQNTGTLISPIQQLQLLASFCGYAPTGTMPPISPPPNNGPVFPQPPTMSPPRCVRISAQRAKQLAAVPSIAEAALLPNSTLFISDAHGHHNYSAGFGGR
eukprot:CAMPEP_0172687428 /NCGR_PEP_ID=MMETSP1074-20121228/21670_1 /TAXON_ID=2916 /ORGANISM="Ceratium fusus, Strain PA161109" /LENGTH=191 /DNA_ID=CAMNT_0013506879 /DNA_START=216 /DNA_END=792 /DNA_ORIENTATION=+